MGDAVCAGGKFIGEGFIDHSSWEMQFALVESYLGRGS
jgi:hypothetical protein